jgi:hypothetical protein
MPSPKIRDPEPAEEKSLNADDPDHNISEELLDVPPIINLLSKKHTAFAPTNPTPKLSYICSHTNMPEWGALSPIKAINTPFTPLVNAVIAPYPVAGKMVPPLNILEV